MRIISGSARGCKLATPSRQDGLSIRPTADRAKEALFSILGERVVQAAVLDLFSGTGALGLEALSRGASRVVFVDYSQQALKILNKNIALCRFTGHSSLSVIRHDLRRSLPPQLHGHCFDLIFVDPPYDQGYANLILSHLAQGSLLAVEGRIVIEERGSAQITNYPPFTCVDTRKYGETGFWFFTSPPSTQLPEIA